MTRARLVRLVAPLLVLVALWVLAVAMTGSTADADQRVNAATEELHFLDTEIDEIRQLEDPEVSEEVARRVARSEAAIPATVDLASVLAEVARLGEVHDVVVEQLAPSIADAAERGGAASTSPSDTSVVSVALSGRGSYSAIMAFFEELGAGDRLVVASSLQLAAIDELDALLFDATVEVFTTAKLSNETAFDDLEGLDDAEEDLE